MYAYKVISVMFNSLKLWGLQLARLPCLWDSPGKNTGVDCHYLLSTQGLNPGLSRCRQIFYHLSLRESLVLLWSVSWTFTRPCAPTQSVRGKETYGEWTLSWSPVRGLSQSGRHTETQKLLTWSLLCIQSSPRIFSPFIMASLTQLEIMSDAF